MNKQKAQKENLDLGVFIVDSENNRTEEFKTICPNCDTQFIKEKFLFDFCPVCKGSNLKEIEGLK